MFAIFTKEINSFFSTAIGYVVISIFLLMTGLFLWVFPGSFNIFDKGFANLIPFFEIAPWIFTFLIPAICMRSFSEERKQGTLELILTKPITLNQLIFGKFFGALVLGIFALIPTILYIFTISNLAADDSTIELGAILSSYFGLILLMACFTSIGIFASSITDNQLIAFISAAFLCLLMFYALEGISDVQLFGSEIYALEYLSLSFHYNSMTRGVLDTRDIIYFLTVSVLFLGLAKLQLQNFLK